METKSKYSGRGNYRDFSKILIGEEIVKNSYRNSITGALKRYLYRNEIKKEKCEDCGITEWNNKKISFDLEHIDGNSSNNLLENLKILCPNCHSQTSTYKGRNIKKK
jgi:Zn finger protein HypA/HybF involved in hydrogenase expression